MSKEEEDRLRGGRKAFRDRWFGIDDKDFRHWWHRIGKEEAGGYDLASREEADQAHQDWIKAGCPKAR